MLSVEWSRYEKFVFGLVLQARARTIIVDHDIPFTAGVFTLVILGVPLDCG